MFTSLKILMIAPTPYFSDRGCHVRIYEEAKALKARGHEVVIVTYHLGRDVGDIPVVRIPNIPWYRKLSAGPSWHKPYLDILLLYQALVTAKKFKPDIIHAHLHEGAFLAGIAKRSFGVPVVFDCQGRLCGELLDHGFMQREGFLHKMFARLEDWITKQSDSVITSSTPTAELLKSNYPEMENKITPLIDGVNTEVFLPLQRDLSLFEKLGIPPGRLVIAYLGAMTSYQGVDLLLKALGLLAEERGDFNLLMMGYPESAYRETAQKAGLANYITFTGKIDYSRAVNYLSLADFAVSPKLSSTEANGKLLNYMACGLPCVVFNNAINRELLGDGGVFVEQQTAEAFSVGMKILMDDPEYRSELSSRTREHVEKNHCWSARVIELERQYEKVLQCCG